MRNVTKKQQERWLVIYHSIVAILAVASSVLATLMMLKVR